MASWSARTSTVTQTIAAANATMLTRPVSHIARPIEAVDKPVRTTARSSQAPNVRRLAASAWRVGDAIHARVGGSAVSVFEGVLRLP